MNKKRFGILFSLVAVIVAITLIINLSSPIKITTVKAAAFNAVRSEYAGDKYHKAGRESFESVCKSGLLELFFDKNTGAVGILDTSADVFWSTLPSDEEEKSLGYSAIEAVLSNRTENEYILNSQDNSVAFGNFSYEKNTNGITVKYALSLDDETGKADINTVKDKIRADITVVYTLFDGSFYVSVNMNSVQLPKGVFLEKLRLLSSFGAYSDKNEGDFIFVPDGSGAIIKTDIEDTDFSPVSLKVYGNDPALDGGEASALFGAFGIKHGNGAFLCIIESAEAIANITAYRNSETSINSVGAEFAVTDIICKTEKSKQVKSLGYEYAGEMKLCYRFLSGKSATYSGMATACRENLIRNSVISSKTVSDTPSSLPLIVNLQFGCYDAKGNVTVQSTFEQATTLMTLLKAKGVNTAYIRAYGLFNNADNSNADKFGEFIKQLGTKEAYDEFYAYIKTQNFPLYIDTPVLTVKKSLTSGAENMLGSKMTFVSNTGVLSTANSKRQYLPLEKLEDEIEALLHSSSSVSFDGFALKDIGTVLYSDYSSDFYSRESSKKEIASQLSVLASYKPVMVTGGSFYSVKNASVITALPFGTAARKESSAYCAIPFVALLLHGTYDYGIESINTSENLTEAFLRTVEFGAIPSADWYCLNTGADDRLGYNNNINDIVAYSVRANDILYDLRDARMTAHYEVEPNVYCTEYNNSTKVYVNYTENAVTVNGITVGARDCIKIS